MPRSRLSNYLRTERIRSGFTQRELGKLLGVSRAAISKAEGVRLPPKALLFLSEIAFGSSQRSLFPDECARLERALLLRALAMEGELQSRSDAVSSKKRAFLGELIKRAQANPIHP
jgi:transcriptional regulator with XRE-family HTH domain